MAPPEGTPPPEALASRDISDEPRDPFVIPEGVKPALRTFWSDMMPSAGENASEALRHCSAHLFIHSPDDSGETKLLPW